MKDKLKNTVLAIPLLLFFVPVFGYLVAHWSVATCFGLRRSKPSFGRYYDYFFDFKDLEGNDWRPYD